MTTSNMSLECLSQISILKYEITHTNIISPYSDKVETSSRTVYILYSDLEEELNCMNYNKKIINFNINEAVEHMIIYNPLKVYISLDALFNAIESNEKNNHKDNFYNVGDKILTYGNKEYAIIEYVVSKEVLLVKRNNSDKLEKVLTSMVDKKL